VTLLLLALACQPAPAPEPTLQADAEPLAFGWLGEVADDPGAFTRAISSDRRAWTALHAHDYRTAAASFHQPTSRARAELAMSLLHHDLSMVAAAASQRLFSEWEARGGLPEEGATRTVAALSAWCAESADAERWARAVAPDAVGAGVAAAIAEGRSPVEVDGDDAVSKRLGLHAAARQGKVETLEAASGLPMVTEEAHGFTRHVYDPCAHHALAAGWESKAAASLGGSGWKGMRAFGDGSLSGRLFSPWLDAADVLSEVERADHPGVVGLHGQRIDALSLPTELDDDPQLARELVRTLDDHLDGWREALHQHAGAEGDALLEQLSLVDRFRQEWLVVAARHLLRSGQPRAAHALLQLAHDTTQPGIGPTNSPSLYALTAAAQLQRGHTRQALDALAPLADSFAAVRGVVELTGDLAVLQGLDRTGDSKESQ
jgi:hypothetical protein